MKGFEKMKRIFVAILLISIMCITGCRNLAVEDSANDSKSDEILMNQKIVFIYHYSNWNDAHMEKGFYIDAKGNKVEYDVAEIVSENWKQIHDFSDIYKIILEFAESNQDAGEKYLSVEEVSKCYKLLAKMGDDYKIKEKGTANDAGDKSWYGVIDDGENEPKLILLSGEGDSEKINSHKNAQKILDILTKTE